MEIELSKREKKLAREIIEKGMHKEFEYGMHQFEEIIKRGKEQDLAAQECYRELYRAIKGFDKKIAMRYDYVKGSSYLHIIVGQLLDNFITTDDLKVFKEEIQERIIRIAEIYR